MVIDVVDRLENYGGVQAPVPGDLQTSMGVSRTPISPCCHGQVSNVHVWRADLCEPLRQNGPVPGVDTGLQLDYGSHRGYGCQLSLPELQQLVLAPPLSVWSPGNLVPLGPAPGTGVHPGILCQAAELLRHADGPA